LLDIGFVHVGSSLLVFDVRGIVGEVGVAYRPHARPYVSVIPAELDIGSDPVAHAHRQRQLHRRPESHHPELGRDDGPDACTIGHLAEGIVASMVEGEDELFQDCDPLMFDDVQARAEGFDEDVLRLYSRGCDVESADRDGDMAHVLGSDDEMRRPDHGFADDDGVLSPQVALDVARESVMDVNGYVRSTRLPWCNMKNATGRISTWPDHKVMSQRSVSTRCYMHPRCSRAVMRSVVSDESLMQWLFLYKPLPLGATAAEAECARDAHCAAWDLLER